MSDERVRRGQHLAQIRDLIGPRVDALARLSPDPAKTAMSLNRLVEHRDNTLFASLAKVCRSTTEYVEAAAAMDDVVRRFGGARAVGADALR